METNKQLAEAHAEMAMLYAQLAQVWLQLDKKPQAIAFLEKAIALELELEDSEDLYHKPEVFGCRRVII